MRICQQPVTVISICCNIFVQLAEMVKRCRAFLFLAMFYLCVLCETLFKTVCIRDVWICCLVPDEPSRM